MNDKERLSVLAPGEQERIDAALDELDKDPHAPREITVKYVLHIHHEYPKAVGDKTANNAEEEAALNLGEEPGADTAAVNKAKADTKAADKEEAKAQAAEDRAEARAEAKAEEKAEDRAASHAQGRRRAA